MNSTPISSSGFTTEKPANDQQEPELLALDQLTESPLPGDRTRAYNPRTGKEMVLPDQVMNAMTYLDSFRTVEEHVQSFVDEGEPNPQREQAITSIIKSIHQGGLTLSARDICARLTPDESGHSIEQRPVVAIATCEHPQALKRLLDSLVNECDPEKIKRCVVIDDSRSLENRRKNLYITSHFNGLSDIDIAYFGASEAEQLMNSLIRCLPGYEQEIRFLIDRERWKDYFTAGLARNYSLLLSGGNPLLVFDDDTICKAYPSLYPESGIEFSDRPRQAHFFSEDKEVPNSDPLGIADPVQQHMQCLGLSLPQALKVLGTGAPPQDSLRHAGSEFAASLDRHTQILITECGTFGDPGTESNNWLSRIPAESRERLISAESQYQLALNDRNCWLGVSRPTLKPRGLISQVTGLDNRELLPPYIPIERGEDGVFGSTVRFIFPNSVCLNYPWAIPHRPIPKRQWAQPGETYSTSHLPIHWLITKTMNKQDVYVENDPLVRLEFLAGRLTKIADSPQTTILEQFTEDWVNHQRSYISELRPMIDEHADVPDFWASHLHRSIQRTQSSIRDGVDFSRLTPSAGQAGGEENIEFWQKICGEFGQAMLAWPEIRREARALIDAQ